MRILGDEGDAGGPGSFMGSPTLLLLVAAAMLYASSRAGADVLAGRAAGRGVRPGRLALGHWLPVAAVALVAVAMRRPEVAIGVVFATAIGCLSLAAGIVTYLSPVGALPPSRRAWQFVLPAALLPLVAGFAGHLTWLHALMMLALGAAVLSVWLDRSVPQPVLAPLAAVDSPAAGDDLSHPLVVEARDPRATLSGFQLVLAVVLAGLGAWAAVRGAVRTDETSRLLSSGAVAAAVVSPLLTLPILGTGSALARRGQSSSMLTTLSAVVLLNLCGLLPAVVLSGYVLPGLAEYVSPTPPPPAEAESTAGSETGDATATQPLIPTSAPTQPTTEPAATRPAGAARPPRVEAPKTLWESVREHAGPTPYPLTVWRVDTVVLVVLGFGMIPISLGRWTLTRVESAGLIVGYAAYLGLVAALAARVV